MGGFHKILVFSTLSNFFLKIDQTILHKSHHITNSLIIMKKIFIKRLKRNYKEKKKQT